MTKSARQSLDLTADFRAAQREVFFSPHRTQWLLWRRRWGKSTVLANKAIQRMGTRRGHSVFVINASLLMGAENVLKESQIWAKVLDRVRALIAAQGQRLSVNESVYSEPGPGRDPKIHLVRTRELDCAWTPEELAGIWEGSKLETRLWHDRTTFSRTRVVAPNPFTARGFGGDVMPDEFGFWPEFEPVMDAVQPMIDDNPEYIMWGATTPPMDDDHPVFPMLMPRQEKFTPSAKGNWYDTEDGVPVHRLDAYDAEVDSGPNLPHKKDKTRLLTVDEARAQARNRQSFDRNYLLKFISGGTAALARHLLLNAQLKDGGRTGMALDLGVIGKEAA